MLAMHVLKSRSYLFFCLTLRLESTFFLSPQVTKEMLARAFVRRLVQVGFFKPLGFVLGCVFADHQRLYPVGASVIQDAYTRCINHLWLC